MFWSFNQAFLVSPQYQNAYTYVGNNPIIFVDPTGEWLNLGQDATYVFEMYVKNGTEFYSKSGLYYLYSHRPGGFYDLKVSNDFKQTTEDYKNYDDETGEFDHYSTNQTLIVYDNFYKTEDLGNFMIGLNGYRVGYSLDMINTFGILGEATGCDGKIDRTFDMGDELYDQGFYKAGYEYGKLEDKGDYSSDELKNYNSKLLQWANTGGGNDELNKIINNVETNENID